MHRQMAPLAAPRKPLDGVSFCLGTTQHVESVVSNNRAMALETEGLELPQATITRGVEAVLSGAVPSAQYYLLARGQEVLAQLMITQEWSDWRASMIWWIQSVYVSPTHRKQGLYKRLYHHVRQEAENAGAAGLRLYAEHSNCTAHAAYERLGMSSHYKVYEDMFTHY